MDWYDKRLLARKELSRRESRERNKKGRVFFKRGNYAVVERMITSDGILSS